MHSEDDELIRRLTDKLAEEVENLPKDGQDHEIRIKIKGNRGNINLGSQTFEIKQGKDLPPPGTDRERCCPQCNKPTWRYTRLCMHCDYDLHAHDEAEAQQEAAHRARERDILQGQIVIAVIAVMVCCGALITWRINNGLPVEPITLRDMLFISVGLVAACYALLQVALHWIRTRNW
jgi:hypothetical protein